MNTFEKEQPSIIYIAYINGKAIAEDEQGKRYYVQMPEEYVVFGEVAFAGDVTPLDRLEPEERKEIEDKLREEGNQ